MAGEHLNKTVPRRPKRAPSKAVRLRRSKVASMLAMRITQGKIAEALKVSRGTIVKDVKALEVEWREAMLGNITDIKARELQELSVIEGEAWVGFQRTRRPLTKGGPPSPGDPKWLRVVLDVKRRRAELLGLDEPIEIRHGLADKDLRTMTDDELDALEQQLRITGDPGGNGAHPTVH